MFFCDICEKNYIQKSGLNRHKREDKICALLRTKLLKLTNNNDLLKHKNKLLKRALRSVKETKDVLEVRNNELVEITINQEKQIKELNDDRNLLFHQLEVEKAKMSTSEKKDKVIVELAKSQKSQTQNNTVINNTVIINDFRIKGADEFDESRKEQLINYIRDKEVSYVYQWLLELLYWTKPPNISIRDQSRKKVMILRENKWIQENVDVLVHRMFYRTIKPIVMNCIEEKIDEYEELIREPENKHDEQIKDELMVWEEIYSLWSSYNCKRLNQPFLQTVSNLQNHNKLLNIN